MEKVCLAMLHMMESVCFLGVSRRNRYCVKASCQFEDWLFRVFVKIFHFILKYFLYCVIMISKKHFERR